MFAGQRRRSSNVRAMQLFHELKQQFPTISDQIVTSCISLYFQRNAQGKKSNLIELIETAIADNKLEQMGRSSQQTVEDTTSPTNAENTSLEAVPSIGQVSTKANLQPERARNDMNDSSSDFNRNLVKESASKDDSPKATPAKRPNHLDIKSDTLSSFQETSEEKRQFNIQLSEKCKDIHKLLSSSISDKPPRSPISAKRFAAKNSPTKIERSPFLSPDKRTNEEAGTSSEVQRRLSQESPLGAVIKKETCSTPTQTTDTLLGSPNVNVSLNVNCSLDVLPSPGQSRRVIPWPESPNNTASPRSVTSVNFTLRPPTSNHSQHPLGGSSPTSGVTYSTSSFDPQKRVQSRLQITVGPGSGSVSSFKVRPRSFHSPETTQEVVPARAGSLNNLVDISEPAVILKQQARLEKFKAELNKEKAKLEAVKKEVAELERNRLKQGRNTDRELEKQLLRDIKHLRYQCNELESGGEAFYSNIYTGQRGPLTFDMPHLRQPNRSRLQYRGPPLFRRPGDDEGPKWNCCKCTFLNHPVLDKCEQCEMPRILHGTNAEAVNLDIAFDTLKLLKIRQHGTRSFSMVNVPNSTAVVGDFSHVPNQPPRSVTNSRSAPNMLDQHNIS